EVGGQADRVVRAAVDRQERLPLLDLAQRGEAGARRPFDLRPLARDEPHVRARGDQLDRRIARSERSDGRQARSGEEESAARGPKKAVAVHQLNTIQATAPPGKPNSSYWLSLGTGAAAQGGGGGKPSQEGAQGFISYARCSQRITSSSISA